MSRSIPSTAEEWAKKMKGFFLLSNVDYDYEEKFFLEGPADMTEEQFNALVASLVPEAGRQALAKAQLTLNEYQGVEYRNMVNPAEIMQEIVTLLVDRGFKAFRPKSSYINGSYVGTMEDYKRSTERYDPETPAEAEKPDTIQHMLKDAFLPICEYNQVEYDKLNARRKVLRHPAE